MVRYTPAATMVAACSRAETEVGPAIAANSQGANGSCADFAAQASTMPATKTCNGRPSRLDRAVKANEPLPAKAAAAAMYSPRSPKRVTRKAQPASRRLPRSRQSWPIRDQDSAPTSSQAISKVSRSAASTSSSIAPTNASSRAISRASAAGVGACAS